MQYGLSWTLSSSAPFPVERDLDPAESTEICGTGVAGHARRIAGDADHQRDAASPDDRDHAIFGKRWRATKSSTSLHHRKDGAMVVSAERSSRRPIRSPGFTPRSISRWANWLARLFSSR